MKILLISPLAENMIIADNPSFIDEERGFNPPLGLLYLAGYLKKYSGYEIEVLDMPVERVGYGQLRQELCKRTPDVVGITAMTFTLIDVIKTAEFIKSVSPEPKVVLGGPHATIYPKETASLKDVDFVVAGEGEKVFLELINNLDNYGKLSNINGLYFKHNGRIFGRGRSEFIEDLDSLPFPARNLTLYKKYNSVLTDKEYITTMFTSRGCPFNCSFCDRPHMGRRFRARSYRNVVDEIEECINMDIKEIFVYDDTFTVNRQRVFDICNEILRRRLKFTWDIRTRVDTVDEPMLKILKKAGCKRIHYGVEAGTDKILKVLNKGITIQQVKDTFRITKKLGITTLAYFMIGSPEETYEDIITTVNFAKEINPDYAHITITTPFPSTDLYQRALNQGVIAYDYWRQFAQNPNKGISTQYWEKELNREQLLNLLKDAYKSFYARPGYIIRSFCKVQSLKEFGRKIKVGFKILFSN